MCAEPFDTVTLVPAFVVNGAGTNVDSLAFFEAPDPEDTLLFVTAKGNQLVEVWRYPFVGSELAPLVYEGFASDSKVNGIVIDPERDRLYIAVSAPASTLPVFGLPDLEPLNEFIDGDVSLRGEPNLALSRRSGAPATLFVSADTKIYVHDAEDGAPLHDFALAHDAEAMVMDDFHEVLYVPDENTRTGVYAYAPDGSPYERNGSHRFGEDVFEADGEGIALYVCKDADGFDAGSGFLVVSDQRPEITDFELFDRETWEHLGVLRLEGVNNTDGVASTQRPLPDYPLGLLVAIDNDTKTAGIGWHEVLEATGLSCATPPALDSFQPTSGPAGTALRLEGAGFASLTEVRVGGALATSYAVDSDSVLRVDVPMDADSGPVEIVNALGSAMSALDFVVRNDTEGLRLEEVESGTADGSRAVRTTDRLKAGPGHLYLASVSSHPFPGVSGVAGLGLDWIPVASQCSGQGQSGVSLWMAQGDPDANDYVEVSFPSSPQHAVLVVTRHSGADPILPLGSAIPVNTHGVYGSCSGSSDSNGYALDLPVVRPGASVLVAVAMRNRQHAPGSGFSELAEVSAGSGSRAASLAVTQREGVSSGQTSVEGGFSQKVDWAVVAVEIRPHLPGCDDGLDNDGDGLSDFPDDPGCMAPADTLERASDLVCDDGLDQDGDLATDHPADLGCPDPAGRREDPECEDGIDNDGDGRIDWDGGPQGLLHDANCTDRPWRDSEIQIPLSACGLGFEVGPVLLLLLRRRSCNRSRAVG